MCLEGYLGMFRKSQGVWARNFDPKGVNASRKPNPGTLCPPPACDRVKCEANKDEQVLQYCIAIKY